MPRRFSGRRLLVLAGLLVGAVAAGCGAAPANIQPAASMTKSLRFVDPQGWSLRYPDSLSLEQSTSGPGMATFTEVTVANFAQRQAVVTGKTHDGGFILVRPPLDHAGRFPADGVAFRMLAVDGGPPLIGTVADSRFPIELSSFARPQYDDFRATDYKALGVPRELTRPIDADGQHYQTQLLIGPAASHAERAAIEAVITSLTFPNLQTAEQAGGETVLGPASRFPVGSFTQIHAPRDLQRLGPPLPPRPCAVLPRPRAGAAPSAGPDPAVRTNTHSCTATGTFYALRWTSEDILGGYRSACQLRFDRRDEQFYCDNSTARWDRTGRPIRTPYGARFADGLHLAFAKIAWDGHVVFLPGLGGNPPRATARALLWPGSR